MQRMSRVALLCLFVVPLSGALVAQSLVNVTTNNSSTWQFATAMYAGDFDGDPFLDLVVRDGNAIHYLPDYATAPPPPLSSSNQIHPHAGPPSLSGGINIGDFDGDGDMDIIGGQGTTSYWLFANNGAGTFAAPVVWGPSPGTLAFSYIGDLNGDGRGDIAQTLGWGGISPTLSVRLSTPTGGFSIGGTITGGINPRVGDFDGDGFDDVATVVATPGQPWTTVAQIQLWRGSAAGMISPPTIVALPFIPGGLYEPADFDRDGDVDLPITQYGANAIILCQGDPIAPLVAVQALGNYPLIPGLSPIQLNVADLDDDGWPDLLANQSGPFPGIAQSTVTMLRNDGTGGFSYASRRLVWQSSLAAGFVLESPFHGFLYRDFDGDGDVDLFGNGDYLTSPPATVLVTNDCRYGAGCVGAQGIPNIELGSAWAGNPAFTIAIDAGMPFAPAILGVSFAPAAGGPCGLLIDADPANLILPSGSSGVAVLDVAGVGGFTFSVPSLASGLQVFAQWFVLDPSGGLTVGGATFSATAGRAITIF